MDIHIVDAPDGKIQEINEAILTALDNMDNRMRVLEPLLLRVGMMITLLEWTSHKDNSYKGDVMKVIDVSLPFVSLKRDCGLVSTINLDTRNVILAELSAEYVEANSRVKEEAPTIGMNFSRALNYIQKGQLLQRSGWNGKNMFVFLVDGSEFKVNRKPLLGIFPEGSSVKYHAHIDMKTANGEIVPWLASQSDMLANDWQICF